MAEGLILRQMEKIIRILQKNALFAIFA